MTNRELLEKKGITDDLDEIFDVGGDRICEICAERIVRNLSPTNPSCEGRWCDEAIEIWLEEEAYDVSDVD